VVVALDPRYKLSNYTKIATLKMFGEVHGEVVWIKMNKTLTKLFEEYMLQVTRMARPKKQIMTKKKKGVA
jgi:hypothetical protein